MLSWLFLACKGFLTVRQNINGDRFVCEFKDGVLQGAGTHASFILSFSVARSFAPLHSFSFSPPLSFISRFSNPSLLTLSRVPFSYLLLRERKPL